jgi:transcriptional regulator with XRE-family HTH domain
MTLGKRLKDLREEKKLTTREMSAMLNIGKSTFSNYENDTRKPDYELLKKLSEYFEVSLDYLLGKTNIKNAYVLENNQLPKHAYELKGDYIFIAKEMQDKEISPERIRKIIEILEADKK